MNGKMMVCKDNKLIHAGYTLTLTEQRVILLCLAKWDSRKKIPDDHEFIISVDDLSKEIGIARENAYRDLRSAVNSLYSRTIKLDPNDPDTEMRWLYQKVFFKEKGVVALRFSPSLLPYISELKERFTSYRLRDVAQFKSSYSIRF
jgi:plasmid replication initiation protein